MAKKISTSVLSDWQPENAEFWQKTGSHIANRNLWISVPCLLLSFCVWLLFSIVAVNLNKIGYTFSTKQLFLLTAIPSVSGAIFRVIYSFVIPIFGGRNWTTFSTLILIVPCLWLGFALQDPHTSFETFVIIALFCGLGSANFASSMGNISFFFPKSKQGYALGINGGLGNMGVSVIQFIAPIVILFPLFGSLSGPSVKLTDGSYLWLQNAAFVWVPLLLICSVMAYFGMNSIKSSQASIREQIPVLKSKHLWIMSLLYLATFGSFIGFSAAFAMLSKTQFPDINIVKFAFFCPLIGAIGRPIGGTLSDKWGGVKMTFINYMLMIVLTLLIFMTLPSQNSTGSFLSFFVAFLGLFFTAGFGSGSTYQMISVAFRQITMKKSLAQGMSNVEATKISGTETSAALGFISAIGAMGGFIIPQVFSLSLEKTGSAVFAMSMFLVFYIVCTLITWFCYARNKS